MKEGSESWRGGTVAWMCGGLLSCLYFVFPGVLFLPLIWIYGPLSGWPEGRNEAMAPVFAPLEFLSTDVPAYDESVGWQLSTLGYFGKE